MASRLHTERFNVMHNIYFRLIRRSYDNTPHWRGIMHIVILR